MIRRVVLVLAAVVVAVLTGAGVAFASVPAPAAPVVLTAYTTPAAAPLTQCGQLGFLGTDAVAACNLGPPSQSWINSLLNKFNLGNGVNNVCQPGIPWPESTSSSDLLTPAQPPAAQRTLSSSYGTSGLNWAPYNLQCSQWEDLLGNSWSNAIFTAAKVITSVTLAVVHAATTPSLLNGIQGTIDKAIVAVGHVAEQWMIVIIALGAAYMGWALLKGRGREVITSAAHMVIFAVPLLLLIAMPHVWTSAPAWTVNQATQVTSDIFSTMPTTGSSGACLKVNPGDPSSAGEGLSVNDHGADALWGFMVCRPWLSGEFPDSQLQQKYGRALLFSQSFAIGEQQTTDAEALKGKLYGGIDNEINQHSPGSVNLFEGNAWPQRMMIAVLAVIMDLILAVVFIGLACTLLFAQVGFFLLMVAAPVVLLVGMYPGTAGRQFCFRWYERMLGLLAKMAIATVLLTGMLWVFSLLTGLSGSWLVQGLLIIGAGVVLVVKRKRIISGAVSARGEVAAKLTGTSTPSGVTAGAGGGGGPRRRAAEAGVLGAAAGYETARHHAAQAPEQSRLHKATRAGQQVAVAYSTGGLTAAGTAVAGLAHGHTQRRKNLKRAEADRVRADADQKEALFRERLPGLIHQQAAVKQLRGQFPAGKTAPPLVPPPEDPRVAEHRRQADAQLKGRFPDWKTTGTPQPNGNGNGQSAGGGGNGQSGSNGSGAKKPT